MQIETELKKATLTHQLDSRDDAKELDIRPHPVVSGTVVLTTRDGELIRSSITVNISELKKVVAML